MKKYNRAQDFIFWAEFDVTPIESSLHKKGRRK